MKLAQLRTWIHTHQTAALGGGVAAAAGLALIVSKRKKASADSGNAAPATSQAAMKGGVYDSTANDVYNSIQPEIDALAAQIAALGGNLGDTGAALGGLPVASPSPYGQVTVNGSPAFLTSTGRTIPIQTIVPVAQRPSETPNTALVGTSSITSGSVPARRLYY
jgi:hypothetical protein